METLKTLSGATLNDPTLFVVDTPANHSVLQGDNEMAQTTHDTFSHGCCQPLASYDHDTQSWKMLGDISLWVEQQLLQALPASGMTQNGMLYQRHRKALRTLGNESSSLHGNYPTMSANGMGNTGSRQMLQQLVDAGVLSSEEKLKMSAGNGGRLNPTWVEWLMGFPLGWTDLEDSETP